MWKLLRQLTRHRKCRFCDAIGGIHDRFHFIRNRKRKDGTIALLIGDTEIVGPELIQLKQDAIYLENTAIWKMFLDTIRSAGVEICVKTSTDFDQVIAGKTLSYSADVLESSLNSIRVAEDSKLK